MPLPRYRGTKKAKARANRGSAPPEPAPSTDPWFNAGANVTGTMQDLSSRWRNFLAGRGQAALGGLGDQAVAGLQAVSRHNEWMGNRGLAPGQTPQTIPLVGAMDRASANYRQWLGQQGANVGNFMQGAAAGLGGQTQQQPATSLRESMGLGAPVPPSPADLRATDFGLRHPDYRINYTPPAALPPDEDGERNADRWGMPPGGMGGGTGQGYEGMPRYQGPPVNRQRLFQRAQNRGW